MSEEPKTVAIDTSAVADRLRDGAEDGNELPKTVAIDSQELAERLEAARRGGVSPAHQETRSRSWLRVVLAAGVVIAVVLYLALS
jgi:predicted RecB family endonuclease